MNEQRFVLAPSVPGLEALGASSIEELAGLSGGLLEEGRAQVVARDGESVLLRIPLPGTPEEGRPLPRPTGRPRGAGTGFVFVRRYRSARLRSILLARFTHPRSTSLAAREWNLYCHLRSEGIATPEPMAVGAVGARGDEPAALFARRSVLVTRELESTLPAAEWLAQPRALAERRAAVRALGTLLQRLHRSRIVLPRLCWEHVRLSESRGGCAENFSAEVAVAGLARRRSMEASLTSVRGGRILGRPSRRALERMLRDLYARAPNASGGSPLAESELLRIFLLATAGSARAERRALLARLASGSGDAGRSLARARRRTGSLEAEPEALHASRAPKAIG